jgi:hypothetical protein
MEGFFSFVLSTMGVVVGVAAKSLWDKAISLTQGDRTLKLIVNSPFSGRFSRTGHGIR